MVAGERFDPPAELSDTALELWDAYWNDRVSGVATSVDRAVLLRWITAHDRYLRASAEADVDPLLTGSTGQLVMNPLYKVAEMALATVQECEKQLGVGGLNRSNLGIAVISERKSLQDMNSRYGGGGGGQTSPVHPVADPRVIEG